MPPAPTLFNGKASKSRGETKITLAKSILNNGVIVERAEIERRVASREAPLKHSE